MALSSVMVTCLALSTAFATCCWFWKPCYYYRVVVDPSGYARKTRVNAALTMPRLWLKESMTTHLLREARYQLGYYDAQALRYLRLQAKSANRRISAFINEHSIATLHRFIFTGHPPSREYPEFLNPWNSKFQELPLQELREFPWFIKNLSFIYIFMHHFYAPRSAPSVEFLQYRDFHKAGPFDGRTLRCVPLHNMYTAAPQCRDSWMSCWLSFWTYFPMSSWKSLISWRHGARYPEKYKNREIQAFLNFSVVRQPFLLHWLEISIWIRQRLQPSKHWYPRPHPVSVKIETPLKWFFSHPPQKILAPSERTHPNDLT